MADEGTLLGEMERGWQRFWRLSWWWKGPIMGFVALFLIGTIGAIGGGGDEEKSDSSVRATTTASPAAGSETEAPSVTTAPTAAPQETTEPTPEPTLAPTDTPRPANKAIAANGAVAEAEHIRVYVHEMLDPWSSDNQFIQPDAGRRFVAFDVTIEDFDNDGSHFASLFNFKLTDVEAFAYDPTFFGPEPQLGSISIPAGQKTRGWVTFEVIEGNALTLLKYDPNILTTKDIEFSFP